MHEYVRQDRMNYLVQFGEAARADLARRRAGSERTLGIRCRVFLPSVADLELGATRKRLAWPSAMETATFSDLPFAAADTASGERWISLRIGSAHNAVRTTQPCDRGSYRQNAPPGCSLSGDRSEAVGAAAVSLTAADVAVDDVRRP